MTEMTNIRELDEDFAAVLLRSKADFVTTTDRDARIAQHGAAAISSQDWPGWPGGLSSHEPIFETYVASGTEITATSDNEPFVSAWYPLVTWIHHTVRDRLSSLTVELDGDAFITASLTATGSLEGIAHMDDDTFVPTDSVGVVAIIGDLAGPRIATGSLEHGPLRPMSQIVFDESQLDEFAAGRLDHCRGEANQLVVFPQFGQVHAGPAAAQVAQLATHRQLLVYRAKVRRS